MSVDVKVPEAGESITEGVLAEWLKDDGALVEAGEDLFELETDKVTMAIPAEVSGKLSHEVPEGTVVEVGQVVATIDTDAASDSPSKGADEGEAEAKGKEPRGKEQADEDSEEQEEAKGGEGEGDADQPADGAGEGTRLAPAARRLVEEHGLDPAGIRGTGKGGRLTKADVLAHLDATGDEDARQDRGGADGGERGSERSLVASESKPAQRRSPDRDRETREKMSPLRHRITERLVQVQQTAAILTTFNECDMSKVIEVRKRYRDTFEKRFDVRLGFMSFFVKAAVDALKTVPQLNARVEEDEIVRQHYYDVGVAVGTEQGLVVPNVRDADQLGFAEIEAKIADLARRAREKKLTLPELTGGCFTISNGGIYGSLLSTPILNPPQSGILGLHRIQKRPVAVDDEVVVRPMMYLALSYDHRIVDGSEAVTFLKRIVECIEDPERMLLEV